MLSKLLIHTAVARIANHEKFKHIKKKAKSKERLYKERMIGQFGKLRWYLSYWFGPWILYVGNKKFYAKEKV